MGSKVLCPSFKTTRIIHDFTYWFNKGDVSSRSAMYVLGCTWGQSPKIARSAKDVLGRLWGQSPKIEAPSNASGVPSVFRGD